MQYQKYDAYKDSEANWIGTIPSHWDVKKIGQCFQHRKEKVSDKDFEPLSVTMQGIVPQLATAAKSDSGDDRKKVCVSDFVINSRSDRKGSSGVSPLDGSVSLISIILKPLVHDKGYIHHLLRSFEFQEEFYRNGKGIVADLWSTKYSDMKNIKIPLPSTEEQQAIAEFIDKKTSEIDAHIDKQERLIALLKERRTAIINKAVTRGLDENVKLKDSGIDWLGEIPEHWSTKKIKYLFKIKKRIAGKTGLDVLSITQNGIKIKDITSGEGQLSMDYSKYQIVEKNDFAMNHMDLLTGYVDISSYDGVTSPDYRVFSLSDEKQLKEYFLNLFQIGYKNKIFYAYGQGSSQLGRWRFPADEFNNFVVPIPPYNEQEKIVKFLERENQKTSMHISTIEKEITALKEYRQSLISNAVTGKIRVI